MTPTAFPANTLGFLEPCTNKKAATMIGLQRHMDKDVVVRKLVRLANLMSRPCFQWLRSWQWQSCLLVASRHRSFEERACLNDRYSNQG